jgi:hypothetical protein
MDAGRKCCGARLKVESDEKKKITQTWLFGLELFDGFEDGVADDG